MVRSGDYRGREQAYVKHFVLERYLQALAIKVAQFRPGTSVNYIDGFSGPWQPATAELRDTSPHIALTQLQAVRDGLAKRNIAMGIRALFVEKNKNAFHQLTELLQQFPEVESLPLFGKFERHMPAVVEFARRGPRPFAFVFIDPTGWTGYGLEAITPLLRVQPSEVLINFMTKDIKRFIDDPQSSALSTFVDLFGTAKYREEWAGLQGLEREDAIVSAYCDRIKNAGGFSYVCNTVILNPQQVAEVERRQDVGIANMYAMALCLRELSRPERYRDELGFKSFEAMLEKHENLPTRMTCHKWFTVIATFSEAEVPKMGGMEKCYTLIRSMKLTKPAADPRELLKDGARVLGVKVSEASARTMRDLLRKRPRQPKVATKEAKRAAERLRNGFRRVRVAAKMRVHVHDGAPCVETHLPAKSAAELVTVLKTAQPLAGVT